MKKQFMLIFTILPFSASSEVYNLEKLILHSDTNLAGKAADVFYVGSETNENNYCTIAATRDYIVATNGNLQENKGNQPELDFSCSWNGTNFVTSSNHKTMSNIKLIKTGGTSSLSIQATLASTKGKIASFNGNIVDIEYAIPK